MKFTEMPHPSQLIAQLELLIGRPASFAPAWPQVFLLAPLDGSRQAVHVHDSVYYKHFLRYMYQLPIPQISDGSFSSVQVAARVPKRAP